MLTHAGHGQMNYGDGQMFLVSFIFLNFYRYIIISKIQFNYKNMVHVNRNQV